MLGGPPAPCVNVTFERKYCKTTPKNQVAFFWDADVLEPWCAVICAKLYDCKAYKYTEYNKLCSLKSTSCEEFVNSTSDNDVMEKKCPPRK